MIVGSYTEAPTILAGSRSDGMKMHARIRAFAACAATDPARFPVEAHARTSKPSSRARVLAIDTGRSLNENVGLTVSFLIHRLRSPNARPRLWACTRGVKPACVSITRSPSIGNRSRYRHNVRGPRAIDSRQLDALT